MSKLFEITLFPAKEGDCILIGYGDDDKKYILIDAGRAWTYSHALKEYLRESNIDTLELVVVTHVDRDHIDGMQKFAEDRDLTIHVKDFWFNTWEHLHGNAIEVPANDEDMEEFGAKMGENLSTQILKNNWPWNKQFNGRPVEVGDTGAANEIQLGDLKLTLISPDRQKLDKMTSIWEKECKKAGIVPGSSVEDYAVSDNDDEGMGALDIDELADTPFEKDGSASNGTSIAFILEYNGNRILLSGDAHADLLIDCLKRLGATIDNPLQLDVFKVPHHGSSYNLSIELLALMDCKHYLVSTNGNYFKHPDEIAMARLIKYGTPDSTLHFNYRSQFTTLWDSNSWKSDYQYKTNYPEIDADGYLMLRIE